MERLVSQGNTRQVNGVLNSGRNSLLESAQEATIPSLATYAMQRQSKGFPAEHSIPHYKHTQTLNIPKLTNESRRLNL